MAVPVLAPRQYCKHRAWHDTLQISPLDVGEIALAVACGGLSSICLGEGLGLDHGVSEDFIFEPRGSMSTRSRFGLGLSELRASTAGGIPNEWGDRSFKRGFRSVRRGPRCVQSLRWPYHKAAVVPDL